MTKWECGKWGDSIAHYAIITAAKFAAQLCNIPKNEKILNIYAKTIDLFA